MRGNLDYPIVKKMGELILSGTYIVSGRRLNEVKAVKDMDTAKRMSDFLLTVDDERNKLKTIYDSLPKGWKTTILDAVKREHEVLYGVLV